jgi:molecular chaperone DnaK (HSP70)
MASGAAPKKLNHPRRRTVRNGARETGLGIPAAPEQSHQCYIIGIDYGATFSAVTYTLVNHDSFLRKTLQRPEPSRVKTLLNYPDQTFSDQVVPTSLVYRVPPDRVAPHLAQQERPSAWGLRSESVRGLSGPGKIKIDLAKLLLTDKETDREPVRVLKRNAKLIRKTGTQLVADFLRKLVEHTSSEIEKEFPARSNSAKYYFCGAPNAWNFAERSRLFSACHAAGIGNVTFVPEAEAAANALLSETQAGDYILKVRRRSVDDSTKSH